MDSSMLVRIVLILAAIFVLFALVSHYNKSASRFMPAYGTERFAGGADAAAMDQGAGSGPLSANVAAANRIQPNEDTNNEVYRPVDYEVKQKLPTDCFPRDRLTADDLLPADAANNLFSTVNPAGSGSVGDANYLTAGVHVGIDTIGQSLRNANMQLRPDPICPQNPVGIWNQTTIAPDLNIKSWC
jgi:hypothetical protein